MRTASTLALVAFSLFWSACNTTRPIVTVNDDGGSAGTAGPGAGGNPGVAGTGSGVGGGQGGGSGSGAVPCDGGAVFLCADATKVCNLADCPGGGGSVGVGTLIACPAAPPTGACAVEFMACAYPGSNSSCRCLDGYWYCTECPSTAQATTGGAVCRYGTVTCSQFGCGVCPAAHPTAGAACGNSRFKCEYGGDVCLCGGNDGWKCTTLSCPQSPASDHRPSCASLSLSDGTGISFNYACSYPAEKQSCACNDGTGYGTYACGCPAALPAEGSACIGPSPCSYGGVLCNCSGGHWNCGGGVCPATKPTAGTACSTQASCAYNDGDGGQGFCACNGTTWSCP